MYYFLLAENGLFAATIGGNLFDNSVLSENVDKSFPTDIGTGIIKITYK